MLYYFNYSSKIGDIYIESDGIYITAVRLNEPNPIDGCKDDIFVIKQAYAEITQYLSGERKNFTLPLCPRCSNFSMRVYQALQNIPFGTTSTYKEIATAIGNAKASRAVGNALRNNPILILIPCHRVIGSSGALVGFAYGLEMKKQLLALETAYPV